CSLRSMERGTEPAPPPFARIAADPLRRRLLRELSGSDPPCAGTCDAGRPAAEPCPLPPGPLAGQRAGVATARQLRRPRHLLPPPPGAVRPVTGRGRGGVASRAAP